MVKSSPHEQHCTMKILCLMHLFSIFPTLSLNFKLLPVSIPKYLKHSLGMHSPHKFFCPFMAFFFAISRVSRYRREGCGHPGSWLFLFYPWIALYVTGFGSGLFNNFILVVFQILGKCSKLLHFGVLTGIIPGVFYWLF